MENDELFDESLKEIFAKRDMNSIYKNAYSNSVNSGRNRRSNNQKNIDFESIRKSIISISLGALLVFGAVKVAGEIKEHLDDPMNVSNMSSSLGMLVNEPEYIVGKYVMPSETILSQNSYRNNAGYVVYNNQNIAKDLLKLDSRLFDYAFIDVCRSMDDNINNKVEAGGRSNVEALIYNLKIYSSMEGDYFSEYVQSEFENIDTLNDYLEKEKYLDKDGNPSLKVAMESLRENVEEIYAVLESELEEKGISK